MDAMLATLIAVWISFCMGIFIVMWVGRGLFGKYLRAFVSGTPLLRVHLEKGGFVFRNCSHVPGGSVVKYPLWSKSDVRYASLVPAASLRAVRALWMDVRESETAPFVFDKVSVVPEEVSVPVLGEGDKPVLGEDGEPVFEKKTVAKYFRFVGWDDSSVMRNLVKWALLRPRRKIAGGFDLKVVVVVIIVVVIAVLVFSQLSGSGGVPNVV